jgi:cell division protein ZapA (FtsZ GTPase activity inhibitor)
MAEKRIINLTIAGRKYPLWVNKLDEKDEEQLRMATKLVNKKMDQYQKKFSNRDIFDILAMTTLQTAKELINSKQQGVKSINIEGLLEINDKLDEIIEE